MTAQERSPVAWLRPLVGRCFVAVAELEGLLPEDADLDEFEAVFRLLSDMGVVPVHLARRRPVGHYPRWRVEDWPVVLAGIEAAAPDLVHAAEVLVKPEAALASPKDSREAARGIQARLLGHEDPAEVAAEPEPVREEEQPVEEPGAQYLRQVSETDRLDEAVEADLLVRAKSGDDEARQLVLESYLGRVVWLSRRYRRAGADRDGLIQAGNLALVEALGSFRLDGPRPFYSHVDRAVRRAFGRFLAEERRTIRIPRGVDKGLRKLLATHERLSKADGVIPSHASLASELGVDVDEVAYLMSYLQSPLSLDAPTAPGEGLRLEETIVDAGAASPSEWSQRVSMLQRLEELLEQLGGQHLRVMTQRYGLLDGIPLDRTQVAAKTGLLEAEVAKIEAEALAHLREFEELR